MQEPLLNCVDLPQLRVGCVINCANATFQHWEHMRVVLPNHATALVERLCAKTSSNLWPCFLSVSLHLWASTMSLCRHRAQSFEDVAVLGLRVQYFHLLFASVELYSVLLAPLCGHFLGTGQDCSTTPRWTHRTLQNLVAIQIVSELFWS